MSRDTHTLGGARVSVLASLDLRPVTGPRIKIPTVFNASKSMVLKLFICI